MEAKRKKLSPSFLLLYCVFAIGVAAGSWFWYECVRPKTYVIQTEFVTKPWPRQNTPIFMQSTKIGFVGKVRAGSGRGIVDLHIYDGGYVYAKDLIAYDATRRSDLHVVPTSRFSKNDSIVAEGGKVYSVEIDSSTFESELFVQKLWATKFEGFKAILEIDEMFLQ